MTTTSEENALARVVRAAGFRLGSACRRPSRPGPAVTHPHVPAGPRFADAEGFVRHGRAKQRAKGGGR